MKSGSKKTNYTLPNLNLIEQQEIDYKIELEACNFMHYIVFISLFVNCIVGSIFVLVFYKSFAPQLIIGWYFVLLSLNVINVLWARYYKKDNLASDAVHYRWRGFVTIIVLICITWGSIGVLFATTDLHKQFVMISILSAAVIAFTFPTAINIRLGFLSIIALLLPIIAENYYQAIFYYSTSHDLLSFNFAIASTLLVLGLFMMGACYLANKVILKVFRLGYEKQLLLSKVEIMNTTLEKKVKERTKDLEKSLRLVTYQATHDLLTNLPNERLLYEQSIKAIEQVTITHHRLAIASLSLNNMGKISDSIGHQAVSKIIHRVAMRFTELFIDHPNYFVSLSRQNVFVILIKHLRNSDDPKEVARKLLDVFIEPVYIKGQELRLTASVGVSTFPEHGRDFDYLMTNAEAARLTAGFLGGNNITIYNKSINADAYKSLNIENLLYSAVENNELILHYQPFVNAKTGKIFGAEALVRWNSPVLGLVAPLDFIPVAEANGMIIPIGEWVIRTACKQAKEWHDLGFKDFRISINLSAKQLTQPGLVDYISKVLDELKLNPIYLDLELTESNVFHKEVLPLIERFVNLGISLSIDDFGTGYSEFSNLKLFKVNSIKIDQGFIEDIEVNIDSKHIVHNTITLAKNMDIECIAEGVETKEQLEYLMKEGCYLMQGYYYSKPVSAKKFLGLLKQHSKST